MLLWPSVLSHLLGYFAQMNNTYSPLWHLLLCSHATKLDTSNWATCSHLPRFVYQGCLGLGNMQFQKRHRGATSLNPCFSQSNLCTIHVITYNHTTFCDLDHTFPTQNGYLPTYVANPPPKCVASHLRMLLPNISRWPHFLFGVAWFDGTLWTTSWTPRERWIK